MVQKKKKKNPIVRLELGIGGLFGLAIVSFCIFLWMFLFGMWTGQTVIESSSGTNSAKELVDRAAKLWQDSELHPGSKILSDRGKESAVMEEAAQEVVGSKENEPSFFSIQVSAFKEKKRASRSVIQWRARDYESFYLLPEQSKGKYYRVFVGRFESLSEANILASRLEEVENDKVFITLVSAKEKLYP